jgi:hypothetical protein
MNTRQIDALNIFLILASLILAFIIPFQLFLFSYAVLGPLHYLTEIKWLREQKFFLNGSDWVRILISITVLVSIPVLVKMPFFEDWLKIDFLNKIFNLLSNYSYALILLAFLVSVCLIFIKNQKRLQYAISGLLLLIFLAVRYIPSSIFDLVIFIPTLIHVYLFTLLFMIFGTLKSGSAFGKLSIIFLILVPVVIFLWPVSSIGYKLETLSEEVFLSTGFQTLSYRVSTILGITRDKDFLLYSPANIKIQIFIAFAYTYHYLNWFSKTSIIGWNKNKTWQGLGLILTIWLGSVWIYSYSYQVGLSLLFSLSLLHVILEFPLNATSMYSISSRIFSWIGFKSSN